MKTDFFQSSAIMVIWVNKIFFCIILLCILATSSEYLLVLLCPFHFCRLLCLSLHENGPLVSLIFLKRSLVFPILLFSYFFALITEESFLISLLFFGTLQSDGYIFPFLLCLLLLFFSQLCVRPPQTTILPFSFLFFEDGFDYCLLYNIANLHP